MTGGIATGKSTVADLLHGKGALIIDADQVSRDLMGPGSPVFQAVVDRFGPEVLTAEGTIERARLGQRVFSDPQALRDLNALTHPPIWRELRSRVEEGLKTHDVVVLMAPLLIEHEHHEHVDQVWLVSVPEAEQVARLRQRNGLSEAEARSRLAAQLPTEAKRRHAHVVIDNGGSREATARQVDEAWARLRAGVGA